MLGYNFKKFGFVLKVACLLVCSGLCSCTYNFSNLHVDPKGLSSISVESVFNTSSMPAPYELLWYSMQEAIIKDGHLKLRSSAEADATVAIRVNTLEVVPTGTVSTSTPEEDPSSPASQSNPLSLDSFLKLSQAYSYNANNLIVLDVTVQIYNLRNESVMFEKRYHFTEELSTLYNYHYPVYKEALEHDIKKLADKVSYNTLHDFMYH